MKDIQRFQERCKRFLFFGDVNDCKRFYKNSTVLLASIISSPRHWTSSSYLFHVVKRLAFFDLGHWSIEEGVICYEQALSKLNMQSYGLMCIGNKIQLERGIAKVDRVSSFIRLKPP